MPEKNKLPLLATLCLTATLMAACIPLFAKVRHLNYSDGKSLDIPYSLTYPDGFICNIDGDHINFVNVPATKMATSLLQILYSPSD
jgi:hypothetical protein